MKKAIVVCSMILCGVCCGMGLPPEIVQNLEIMRRQAHQRVEAREGKKHVSPVAHKVDTVATQGRADVTAKRKTGAKKFTVLLNRAKRFFCGNKQEGVANLTQAQFAQLQAVTENVQVAEHKTGAKKLASLVWGHRRGIMKATFWTCVGGITLTFAGSGMMHQLALASPAAKEFIYKNGLYKIAYCAGWGANMTVNMARNVWQLLGLGN